MAPSRRGRARGRSRPPARLLAWAGLIALVWAGGLVWFVETLPKTVADPETRTDALVVLTGGRGRLEAGLELLDRRMGGRLFVSGVFPGMDVRKLLDVFREGDRNLENLVSIGTAPDTITNAAETVEWMERSRFRDMRLVTSAYHMPRALMEFRAAMPDRNIIANPVFTDHVKQRDWWAWPGTTALMIEEYNKYLLAWLRLKMEAIAATAAH